MSLISEFSKKYGFDDVKECMKLLKATCFPYTDFNKLSVLALIHKSMRTDLNPFNGEVYVVKNEPLNGEFSPTYRAVIGIEGWIRVANRDPEFDGVEYDYSTDSLELDSTLTNNGERVPVKSFVYIEAKIYRKNISRPFTAKEYYDECFSDQSEAWNSKPKRRLKWVSFSEAAKLAFNPEINPISYQISDNDFNEFDELMKSLGVESISEFKTSKKRKEQTEVTSFVEGKSQSNHGIENHDSDDKPVNNTEAVLDSKQSKADSGLEVSSEDESDVVTKVEGDESDEAQSSTKPEVEEGDTKSLNSASDSEVEDSDDLLEPDVEPVDSSNEKLQESESEELNQPDKVDEYSEVLDVNADLLSSILDDSFDDKSSARQESSNPEVLMPKAPETEVNNDLFDEDEVDESLVQTEVIDMVNMFIEQRDALNEKQIKSFLNTLGHTERLYACNCFFKEKLIDNAIRSEMLNKK